MPAKDSGFKNISVHDKAYLVIAYKAKLELRSVPQYVEFHLGR